MKTLITHLLAAVAGVAVWSEWGPGMEEKRGRGQSVVSARRAAEADEAGGKVRVVSGEEGRGVGDALGGEGRREAWLASFDDAGGGELRAGMMVDWEEAQELLGAVRVEQRGLAAMDLAVGLLHESPETAMAMAGLAGDEDAVGDARRAVSVAWAQLDPRAAAEWILSGNVGAGCLAAVVGTWAGSDLLAASAWMDGHGGAIPDEARLALIEPLIEVEPESARGWAESLADGEVRRLTIERIDAGY